MWISFRKLLICRPIPDTCLVFFLQKYSFVIVQFLLSLHSLDASVIYTLFNDRTIYRFLLFLMLIFLEIQNYPNGVPL